MRFSVGKISLEKNIDSIAVNVKSDKIFEEFLETVANSHWNFRHGFSDTNAFSSFFSSLEEEESNEAIISSFHNHSHSCTNTNTNTQKM